MKDDSEAELDLNQDDEKYYPCNGDCETECSGREICPLLFKENNDPRDDISAFVY